jgi:hypothetical protein
MKPKALPVPADKKSSSPCISEEAERMQERLEEARRIRRQIADLERQLDRVLSMDYARRAPAHRTLTRAQALGKFESLEALSHEHRQTQ